MQLTVILAILMAIGGVSFALQNNVPVTVTFLVWRLDSTLAMVLLIALALGALIVALVSTPATLKAQWTASRLRKQLDSATSTNHALERKIAELEGRLAALPQPPASAEPRPMMPDFPMPSGPART